MEDQVADFIRNGKSVSLAEEKLSQKQRLISALHSVANTLKKVFPYILLSVAVGAIIHNWIPENWIVSLLGKKNPLGVILAVFAAFPCMQIFLAVFQFLKAS